jgi:hypothetical protein
MVELQIVILAVAGSSPVGHPGFPPPGGVACALLKNAPMLNPDVVESKAKTSPTGFWLRLLNDEQLQDCDDLQKLVIGCEIIAALDAVDLLAA